MATNVDTPANTYARSALVGVVAGLRSTVPFTLQSWLKNNEMQEIELPFLPQAHINTGTVRTITSLIALGELFGDKTSRIPSRISPGPLAGRVVIGVLAGMMLARRAKQSPVLGALLGGAGAGLGSFAGYYARTTLARVTKLPDPLLGAGEDLLALGLGTLALRGTQEEA